MATNQATIRAAFARRIPDPVFEGSGLDPKIERHIFVVAVRDVPEGLPDDPNARRPNLNRRVYRGVEESLLNQGDCTPNTFHLKNKGITLVADKVDQISKDEYRISMTSGMHGIVDGGHTYKLIVGNQNNPDLPANQFVQIEVRCGIPLEWIPEIAGGLNTAVQVQDMSLDYLKGLFGPIQKILKGESYYKQIAWSENDPGEYDARDIVALMTLFNIEIYPNDKDSHPVEAYEKKSAALKLFEDKPQSFDRMTGILKDILVLHDTMAIEARDIWNKNTGGKAGHLAFMERKKKGQFKFHFIKKDSDVRLINGALYPMLAAFRWYVSTDNKTGEMHWRDGFQSVLDVWRETAAELLRATHHTSNELARNPNAIGKSRNHWANLHTRLAKHDLMARTS